jgi:hypothetical protein
VSQSSPGLALIDGDTMVVGTEAQRNARLRPRRIHSRFWQNLDTRPLARPFPHHLRTADLAHAHLAGVWQAAGGDAGEVILVVPGCYSREQLALLLGIAEAAEVPVRGLVDLAAAAAADRETRRRCFHIDLHLHRTVLTEIEHGSEVVRGRVWENDGLGLFGLWDLWARNVGRQFVRQTRFDPLHLAITEQLLYLELPRHLETLTEKETTRISITSGGRNHAIELARSALVASTAEVTELISHWVAERSDLIDVTLLVGSHMALVPGLVDRFRETPGSDVVVLHPAAAGSAALRHAGSIVSEAGALPFVTRLPGYDARPPGPVTVPVTPPSGAVSVVSNPTHFVVDGVAQPIIEVPTVVPLAATPGSDGAGSGSGEPVTIRRKGATVVVEAPPGIAVVVNGRQVESSAALTTGDRLLLGEPPREVILVTMVS